MGDPRVCGGLNGGKSDWRWLWRWVALLLMVAADRGPVSACLGSYACVRVHVRATRREILRSRLSASLCGRVVGHVSWPLRDRCRLAASALRRHCGVGRTVLLLGSLIFVFAVWCTPHACARAIRAAFRGNSRKFCVKSLACARIERVHYYTKWGYLHIIAKTWG